MAGISKIEELQARKRALVTESEICRETLKVELHNLLLYGSSFRKRFEKVRSAGPWFLLAVPIIAPLLGFLFHKKKSEPHPSSGIKGKIATALVGLRLFRKYSPMVSSLVSHFMSKRRSAEDRTPASNI